MSTYYERKEATDLPKESGYYPTNRGRVYFSNEHQMWAKTDKSVWPAEIEYYFVSSPSPIPSMTQEQVSELGWEAHKYNHRTIDGMPFVLGFRVGWQDCEEYLSTNTLSLKQEVEELKEKLKQSEYNLLVVSETAAELEKRIASLTEQVEQIREAVANYVYTEGCSCCEGQDHKAHQSVLAELLSIEKYDDDSGYNFGNYRTTDSPTVTK